MSIQEQKITEAAIAANGVQSRPDKLTGTAAQNKKVFDALVTAVVREKFNALLDELTGTTAAAQLGITTIPGFSAGNIQTALEQIVQAMQDVTQGSVADGSITLLKLAAEVTAVALGGAAASHTHGAGDINSGVLDTARIPVLDGTKLGTGSVGTEQLGAAVDFEDKALCRAYLVDKNEPVVRRFEAACKTLGVEPELVSTYGGSDNNHFFHHGVRGVVVACGMNNCHSCGEYSSAADLTAAAKLVETLILSRD